MKLENLEKGIEVTLDNNTTSILVTILSFDFDYAELKRTGFSYKTQYGDIGVYNKRIQDKGVALIAYDAIGYPVQITLE